jgi:hypothetical protein
MSRKMVKWAPFVSLKEQTIYLNKLKQERLKVERPILSEDEMNAINDILVNYDGRELLITYYDKGYVKEIRSTIRKIDSIYKKVVTPDKSISFDDLIRLED